MVAFSLGIENVTRERPTTVEQSALSAESLQLLVGETIQRDISQKGAKIAKHDRNDGAEMVRACNIRKSNQFVLVLAPKGQT